MKKGKKHIKLSTVGSSFDLNVSSQGVNSYGFFYLHNMQIEADPPTHPSICTITRKEIRTPLNISMIYCIYCVYDRYSVCMTFRFRIGS